MYAPAMRAWFAATAFVAAALLFVVEPMVGKLLLPILGGAPAVWATCLVFFQLCLLAGYAWAHAVTRLPPRAQPVAHAVLLAAGLWALPLRSPVGAPPGEAFPVPWLLGRLAVAVALPFVAVAATGPLVQRWIAARGQEPYALFAASNAGSLIALLAYPVAVEPFSRLREQCAAWSWGYWALAAMVVGCGLSGKRGVGAGVSAGAGADADADSDAAADAGAGAGAGRWLVLAFVPSSLMLGVTTFVTTDVAPVPLLWVVPLALYLVAFIVPFTARPIMAHERVLYALPAAVLVLAFTLLVGSDRLLWVVVILHFAAFFVIALACHGELARTRPTPERLTTFYLVVSTGGALGGVFNAIVAPLVFRAVWEYPLIVAVVCFLRGSMPGSSASEAAETWEDIAGEGDAARRRARRRLREAALPVAVLVTFAVAMRLLLGADETWRFFVLAQLVATGCAMAWFWRDHRGRFARLVAAMLMSPIVASVGAGFLYQGRSFFSVHRVVDDVGAHRHLYVQGTTVHGLQSTLPERRRVAGAYFHVTGPAGEVMTHVTAPRVGLIGLGVASLATYADAGQHFTFYEIDPVVAHIAEDSRLFTFIADARARGAIVDIVLGDARVRLAAVPDASYDLLVLDAYSSDVVPTHLLTREALDLYLAKVAPRGLILMNMSNRYLDLGRVVSSLAREAGLTARDWLDDADTEEAHEATRVDGKAVSRWILMAREASDVNALSLGSAWKPLAPTRARPWSDDYVNIVAYLRW
jgi:hypothetical protein